MINGNKEERGRWAVLLLSDLMHRYTAAILALPPDQALTREALLADDFLLSREGKISVYFAPHNEYLNPLARIAIVGITPGWSQMELAFRKARMYLADGLPVEEVCKRVKAEARFAGGMRKNLTEMLNALELHRYLGAPDCEALFSGGGAGESRLHTTSMLRYPVFVDGGNYNGHSPAVLPTPFLRESALVSLRQELSLLGRPLLVPLGKSVEAVLRVLAAEGEVDEAQCLWGFPHPSGANGHRRRQFAEAADGMRAKCSAFFQG